MKPRTGLHEDSWAGRHATEREREFGAWAAERGLFVHCGRHEYDDEDTGEYIVSDITALGIEELIDGKIHCLMIETHPEPHWPEQWDHYEKLLRAGFERNKEQHRYANELIQMVLNK